MIIIIMIIIIIIVIIIIIGICYVAAQLEISSPLSSSSDFLTWPK